MLAECEMFDCRLQMFALNFHVCNLTSALTHPLPLAGTDAQRWSACG